MLSLEVRRLAYGTYDETHQRILESGMKMFLEKGFERTNLRDLCAEAGVTTGSFYRHFTSKEDIFSYNSDSNGAKDYEALTGEILSRLNK